MIEQLEPPPTPRPFRHRQGRGSFHLATPTPRADATPCPTSLKKGMKNSKQVKNLQDRLHKLGWFNGVQDGDFGPATQTVVKLFKRPSAWRRTALRRRSFGASFRRRRARGDDKTTRARRDPAPSLAPEGAKRPPPDTLRKKTHEGRAHALPSAVLFQRERRPAVQTRPSSRSSTTLTRPCRPRTCRSMGFCRASASIRTPSGPTAAASPWRTAPTAYWPTCT